MARALVSAVLVFVGGPGVAAWTFADSDSVVTGWVCVFSSRGRRSTWWHHHQGSSYRTSLGRVGRSCHVWPRDLGLRSPLLGESCAHERVHVLQYERWGPLFIPLYLPMSLLMYAKGLDPYLDNCFEREAFEKSMRDD